ncbi:MAG TPA: LacI family DNA-binding transcriptional regulator [Lapillicoccus sp.]|nr:LacI family DNA-binding transcriptional regulator [Lapillicoccus sp.]
MSRPPTLETVAERAGVSRATVSRVVNGDDRVADALRVAVEDAISELGFVPNHAARSLAMRRTGVVALIVGDTDPWPMAGETRDAAAAADLQLLVLLAGDAAANARVAAYARHHVDGVLLLADDDELVRQLAEWRVPVVVGGRVQPTFAGVATVDVDNVGGGRLAAQRLLDRGRRRLGIVAEPVESAAAADREAGFRQAADVEQVVRGDGTTASGERAMRALLETAPGIEGVFVAGDQMALGALHVLAEAGRRVPDDVAVVGFDDLDLAAYSTPPLTTIRVPWAAQASQMVGVLVDRIAGRDTPASVVLDVELVERESA